jgi:DNA-binding MarR family transcriptional regulator
VNPPTSQTPISRDAARIPDELLASPTFLLKRLGWAAKDRSMAAYEGTGLHPYHYAILLVLEEGSHETQGSIADALGYDRGQLVGLLDELEEQKLVERMRDPNDRRRHIVTLTADGSKTLRKLQALSRKTEDEFLAPLSEEQRAELHALLLQLALAHEPRWAHKLQTAVDS